MDLFVEQLVVRRNRPIETVFRILMWAICGLAALSCLFVVLFMVFGFLSFLGIPAAAGIIYAAWYLNGRLNLEFEYILTNGDVDIDLITNRSSRKRITSFECKNVESVSRYRADADHGGRTVVVAANADAPVLMAIDVLSRNNGRILLVIEPDEKFYETFRRCLPRTIAANLPERVEDLA